VDRDIFVRFLGGGVGHMATNTYTARLRPKYHDVATSNDADNKEDNGGENMPVDDGWDSEHGGSESEGDNSDTSGNEDDGLDYNGEDREEPWDVDDTDALGFADF